MCVGGGGGVSWAKEQVGMFQEHVGYLKLKLNNTSSRHSSQSTGSQRGGGSFESLAAGLAREGNCLASRELSAPHEVIMQHVSPKESRTAKPKR